MSLVSLVSMFYVDSTHNPHVFLFVCLDNSDSVSDALSDSDTLSISDFDPDSEFVVIFIIMIFIILYWTDYYIIIYSLGLLIQI